MTGFLLNIHGYHLKPLKTGHAMIYKRTVFETNYFDQEL